MKSNNFLKNVKKNHQKLIDKKNKIINKLLRLKRNDKNILKEEYLNVREEWNKRREETKDERNRRECEEMLEEMRERSL